MAGYVELERNNIKEVISKIDKEEKWYAAEPELVKKSRLEKSDELFLYYKKSIKRCSRLTTNQTFFNLFKEYKIGLSQYVQLLTNHLPVINDENRILELKEMVSVLQIVNTAEYCRTTIEPLADSIKQIIDPMYRELVDMNDTTEEFATLINKGIGVVVSGIFNKLNRVLTVMTKMPWATWEAVGDQSDYVNQINNIFREDAPVIAKLVSPAYHIFFCTQMVSRFIPSYVSSIFKCKRIGELGGQQMALDANTLTSILLGIPDLGQEEADEKKDGETKEGEKKGTPQKKKPQVKVTAYSKYVKREMGKAEALLKTLVSPAERMITTFTSLLRENGKVEDLVKIMMLRGIKKSDQQALFEGYNLTVNPEDRLAPVMEGGLTGLGKLFSKLEQVQVKIGVGVGMVPVPNN